MAKQQVVDTRTAEIEFERFAEEWDIETNMEALDEDSRTDFERLRRTVVRAIEEGRASVSDGGELTYELRKPIGDTASITFRVPNGNDYMSMDSYKDKETTRKTFAFLASMTGQNVKFYGKMHGTDIKFGTAIVSLFMGS